MKNYDVFAKISEIHILLKIAKTLIFFAEFFAHFQTKNDYEFAKISTSDVMVAGNYDDIVILDIIFSPCRKKNSQIRSSDN